MDQPVFVERRKKRRAGEEKGWEGSISVGILRHRLKRVTMFKINATDFLSVKLNVVGLGSLEPVLPAQPG